MIPTMLVKKANFARRLDNLNISCYTRLKMLIEMQVVSFQHTFGNCYAFPSNILQKKKNIVLMMQSSGHHEERCTERSCRLPGCIACKNFNQSGVNPLSPAPQPFGCFTGDVGDLSLHICFYLLCGSKINIFI